MERRYIIPVHTLIYLNEQPPFSQLNWPSKFSLEIVVGATQLKLEPAISPEHKP
jgi:hypothetical protein